MIWFIIAHLLTTLLAWLRIGQLSDQDKALEILLLRQQLVVLQRQLDKPVRPSRIEKLTLAVITAQLKTHTKRSTVQLRDTLRLFQPETVLKWHRELVRRKWTYQRVKVIGQPSIADEVEALIVRFARENAEWGYGKIEGELRKLGYDISDQTVANVLKRHDIPPVPQRQPSVSWHQMMIYYKA